MDAQAILGMKECWIEQEVKTDQLNWGGGLRVHLSLSYSAVIAAIDQLSMNDTHDHRLAVSQDWRSARLQRLRPYELNQLPGVSKYVCYKAEMATVSAVPRFPVSPLIHTDGNTTRGT